MDGAHDVTRAQPSVSTISGDGQKEEDFFDQFLYGPLEVRSFGLPALRTQRGTMNCERRFIKWTRHLFGYTGKERVLRLPGRATAKHLQGACTPRVAASGPATHVAFYAAPRVCA